MSIEQGSNPEPPYDCSLCPRLVEFREQNRKCEPHWFNGPVPSFGDEDAQLLVVGLAPGLRGANRTGRPFTGDFAGDLLYGTLTKVGFAEGEYQADPHDNLQLKSCMITNAVRCVPPQNKPTGDEAKTCRRYLRARIAGLKELRVILALGRIAHDNVVSALDVRRRDTPFAHNASHSLSTTLTLIDSYHCSRYNTNTGRLTNKMFEEVFARVERILRLDIR